MHKFFKSKIISYTYILANNLKTFYKNKIKKFYL